MGKRIFFSYCVILNILLVKGQTYTSVVNTKSGPVRGIISTTIENVAYAAFKGIPFAKPPVNYLRFKPPVEIDPWADVYNATSTGNICTQFNYTSNSVVGSEDCLFINVYTPHTVFNGSISKPVMVWIYGGGFTIGYADQCSNGPDFILGEDVIFVSFNYRISALGFLNLEHENATGNYGLKDQNLALKWVKRNIAQFGGNPDKITIFGQSAGAASVDLQILSDMSVGLFEQSISMSGTTLDFSWGIQSRTEALKNAFSLGSNIGTSTVSKDALLETLYNATAEEIIFAANKIDLMPFRPTIEKSDIVTDQEKFLTECSVKKYRTGNYTKGPHMLGFTANETVASAKKLASFLNTTQSALATIKNATSNIPIFSGLFDAVVAGMENSTIYTIINQTTDLFFILGIDFKQKMMSHNNAHPIYYYRFSFVSNYSITRDRGVDLDGVGHDDDLPYIFYMPWVNVPLNQSDIAITRQRYVKLFTNFAKYGNPTPDAENDEVLGITWPDSRAGGEHLEIGRNLTTGPRPTDDTVETLQLFELGGSPILNDCTNTALADTINDIVRNIGFLMF